MKFPFNEFENITKINQTGIGAYELGNAKENIASQANDNKIKEKLAPVSCESQILDKNQGVTLKNATPFQIGGEIGIRTLGAPQEAQLISSQPHSTTLPSHLWSVLFYDIIKKNASFLFNFVDF